MGCTCYSDETFRNAKENHNNIKKKEQEEKIRNDKKMIKSTSISNV